MSGLKMQACVAAVAVVLAQGALARAQELTRLAREVDRTPAADKDAGPLPVRPSIGPLTEQELSAMLETLGYEPKTFKTAPGDLYVVRIPSGPWTYAVRVSLSRDRKKVWLTNWVTRLEATEEVPAALWPKLVEANFRYGPAHFSYEAKARQLVLGLPLDNRGITLGFLRQELDRLVQTSNQTILLWDKRTWTTTAAAAGK
jgi:hypothetical protein